LDRRIDGNKRRSRFGLFGYDTDGPVREKVRGIPETVLVRSKEKETRETKNP
jgi:hypothetical protein